MQTDELVLYARIMDRNSATIDQPIDGLIRIIKMIV